MEKKFDNISKKITRWIGSVQSIIVHTIFFVVIFGLHFFDVSSSDILLLLTTVVSLEAIYLSIFIQMTVNKHTEELEEVSEDVDEIQKDVDEIQEDVDEIQKDVDEIQEDVEDIHDVSKKNTKSKTKKVKKVKSKKLPKKLFILPQSSTSKGNKTSV
jgi:low affinity Fe/Cu permease